MALYELSPIFANGGAWKPWYDKMFGAVVRAGTEEEARQLAASACSDEGKDCWLDPAQSTCVEIQPDGEPQVIIRDIHNA